jgi:3-oxoacyl-[acyl-carrier-protein] synthase II
MAAITCLGNNLEQTWAGLKAGRSGISPIQSFDTAEFNPNFAGEVRNFDPEATGYIDAKEVKQLDRYVAFAITVAQDALADSGLKVTDENRDNIAVVFGSGMGGSSTLLAQQKVLEERGARRVSPFMIANMLPDSGSGYIAIKLGVRGPNMAVVSACATGGHNVGEAWETIRRGDADVAVTGSAEYVIMPLTLAGFISMRALATHPDPTCASRPFDKNRNGFVVAEGAACLILEELEHAQARGARIYAEMIGYGSSNDAYHMAAADDAGGGATRCMNMAIRKAGIAPEEVDYINAHGTATPLNDRVETTATKTVFGNHAYTLAISSIKSMIGHAMGAAGSIEAVASVMTIVDQVMPPTINYETPDPDCDLDYVPNVARPAKVDVVLSNSIGLGGHNSSIIFRRYQP